MILFFFREDCKLYNTFLSSTQSPRDLKNMCIFITRLKLFFFFNYFLSS